MLPATSQNSRRSRRKKRIKGYKLPSQRKRKPIILLDKKMNLLQNINLLRAATMPGEEAISQMPTSVVP